MRLEHWLGKDNKLGMDIWTKKYQQNNETFDEWLDRVSGGNEAVKDLINLPFKYEFDKSKQSGGEKVVS